MYPLKLFLKNRYHLIFLGLAGGLNLCSWIWAIWNIRPQEDPLFLHYSVLFGVDLIGPWYRVFFIPLAGTLLLLLNTVLGWLIWEKEPFASKILLLTSVLIELLILGATVILVYLNV